MIQKIINPALAIALGDERLGWFKFMSVHLFEPRAKVLLSLDWIIGFGRLAMLDAIDIKAAPELAAARKDSAVASLAFWLSVSCRDGTV